MLRVLAALAFATTLALPTEDDRGRPVVILVHGRAMLDRDTAATRKMWLNALTAGGKSITALPLLSDRDVRVVWYADVLDPRSSAGCDYASNTLICTYPDGLDTEVFSFAALETACRDARRATDREHVTPYLRTSKRFRLRSVESDLGRTTRHLRWTVDEARDLEFVRAVYTRLGGKKIFGWLDVLSLLDAEPFLPTAVGLLMSLRMGLS